jgi:hypothetical protein
LAVGGWVTTPTVLGIDLHDYVNILGVEFGHTMVESMKASWSRVINAARAHAQQACSRKLCLAQRIQYVHHYLLAKIWHVAHISRSPGMTPTD